jgi:hypothetical protein
MGDQRQYIISSSGVANANLTEENFKSINFSLIDIACHQAGAQVLTLLFTSAPNSIRDLMIQTVVKTNINWLILGKISIS